MGRWAATPMKLCQVQVQAQAKGLCSQVRTVVTKSTQILEQVIHRPGMHVDAGGSRSARELL
jgi:hypothetical protein